MSRLLEDKDIIERLKAIKKVRGITTAELAGEIGYSRKHLDRLFQGRRPIDTLAILNYLGLEKVYRYAGEEG